MFLALSAVALSIMGGIKGAQANKAAGETNQALLNEQAGQEMQDAKIKAGLIRRMGRAQVGETKSAVAKAGLDVNSSAAGDMFNAVDSAVENDAMMALLTGERRSRALINQGRVAKANGDNAAQQSIMSGASSALSTVGKIGG